MLDKAALARLIEYTVWANHRLLRVVATLPVDDFKRDLKSSHGGVRGTLTHTLWAEWLWLERWKGLSPRDVIDESEFGDLLQLRNRWAVIDEHRQAWLQELREDAPGATVSYRNTEGRLYEAPLWQLVQHLANHSTYHRGQVMSFARQLGAKAASTDLLLFDREAKARALARATDQ